MTRIEQLRTAAGQAGDVAQVEMCDRALEGDAQAVADCLDVCRDAMWAKVDLRAWSREAELGSYLAEYWDGERDPGSRCGLSDQALDSVRRALRPRGLRIEADDTGIRVVAIGPEARLSDDAEIA